MGKQTIAISETKGADQLRSEADQRLSFRYTDSIRATRIVLDQLANLHSDTLRDLDPLP